MTVEERLAAFVADLDAANVPGAARRAVGMLLWDTSACMLAGLGDHMTDRLRSQVIARGGAPESSLVGDERKVPAPQAALHNGMLAHWSEWDDTFDPGAVHGSAVIFPTLLAVGEARQARATGFLPQRWRPSRSPAGSEGCCGTGPILAGCRPGSRG
jgi:2-methylcitrate dehydratase PrpD